MKIFTRRELTKALKDIDKDRTPEAAQPARREMLSRLGMIATTGAVFYACGKDDDDVVADELTDAQKKEADAKTLNAALGLEQEAVAVYTAAAGLNIWTGGAAPTYKDIAVTFAGHHAVHAATLSAKIKELGGMPVTTKTAAEYFKISPLTGTTLIPVLQYALKKELGAAQAYAALAGSFKDPMLAAIFAAHAADEAAHYATFRAAFTFIEKYVDATNIYSAAGGNEKNIIPGATPDKWPSK